MEKACSQPNKEEIIFLIKKIENWNLFTPKYLTGEIVKHYKGKCNPTFIKEIVEEFTFGVK